MAFGAGGSTYEFFQTRGLAARPTARLGKMVIRGKLCAHGDARKSNARKQKGEPGHCPGKVLADRGCTHRCPHQGQSPAYSLHGRAAPVNSTRPECDAVSEEGRRRFRGMKPARFIYGDARGVAALAYRLRFALVRRLPHCAPRKLDSRSGFFVV